MTPTPKVHGQYIQPGLDGESIVISGMSGLFPMSESVKDFSTILYGKINPVTSDNSRWKWSHPEASEYIGKVPGLDRFDAQFFMVHNRLGNCMDPMARKALEQSYQALYDAGISPKHLNGKKIGVFLATALSEMEKYMYDESVPKEGYRITGSSKTMYANRISYWLNVKGPSMTLDDACCGSSVALEQAYSAINSGACEAAIVGGTNLSLLPHTQVHYSRCIKISHEAETRSFDENACGCTKSEAITVLFLQKAKHALRAYAEVVYVKNEFISKLTGETGQMFGFLREPDNTAMFLKQFYEDVNISPEEVEYVEAFGSANPEADKAELQAIEKVFCGSRSDPLMVGSVISNVGFTDSASGNVAIMKVLLGYHNGLIASNLHCIKPRQDIAAIREGKMSIVTDHQPFRGTYAAVNCLSVTGVNSHVLLRGVSTKKDFCRYQTSIPRLVNISTRQEADLKDIFNDLKLRQIDPEELALLHNIHSTNISGHLGRGYIILDKDNTGKTISLIEKAQYSDGAARPLWFVYSGMGSQWAGMGAQLMRIPIFAAAIERCHKVLTPKGINLLHIITSSDKTIFEDVLSAFVGIAAIQIGLTDILLALGLRPDYIIGHSVGELGCAYADGCLTAEEMVLSAYSRGKASNDTPIIRGAMAAVGLGYQQLSKMCPPAIEIACHNSATSCTISGPEENVRNFVSLLTSNGVFAKEVPCANIAYHSRYIADAAPNLCQFLSEIITEPRARSERWLSTSVPQERWDEPIAKYCSPEYLTNNLLSSVYFEETSRLIPSNAVLVEVAPHGLLQAILKRSLPDTCKNIPLTQRGHKDNTVFLLDAIGKLYIEGYTPQLQAIYPEIEFPVSTGTPHLAHHVKWNHSDKWVVSGQNLTEMRTSSSCYFPITIHDEENDYLKGNVVQGKILYPFAATLVAVWDTLAMTLGRPKKSVSVQFSDVHLNTQPILHDQKKINLNVSVHRGSGSFEVLDGDSLVASGYITEMHETNQLETKTSNHDYIINADEIYQHLNNRGYNYRDEFRSIHTTDESITSAQILWKDNWVTLIDGMIQLNALNCLDEGVSQLSEMRNFSIDIKRHLKSIQQTTMKPTVLTAELDEILDCTRCGGILIQNLKFHNLRTFIGETFKINASLHKNIIRDVENNNTLEDSKGGKKNILQIKTVGDLKTLHWEESPICSESGIKVKVQYTGITISDFKRAAGVIPCERNEKFYGMDFSGLTESGDRVMGLLSNGAASSEVSARPELLWPVPAHWSLEEAATVPFAYLQAFYCLCVKTDLQPGSKVLVHGAAGALGQAAVSVAIARGCRVFATVADSSKKRFLLRLFPQLKEDEIGCSRDASFGDMVLSATKGEGCNIILSCVREDLKNISLKCAAFSGITIDTMQLQNHDNYEYGMFNMTRQRSYIATDFYSVLDPKNNAELRKLQILLSEGIARGYVRPLSHVVYEAHEAARAFQLLATSRHRGRVLLRVRNTLSHSQPRMACSPNNSHLILWDGSPFGLQLTDRLISRGARKIRIHCLKTTKLHLLKLRLWRKMGVDVQIFHETLDDSTAVYALLDVISQRGPVEGIYITVVSDLTTKKTHDLVSIIDHLDTTSSILCPLLKYFVTITIDSNIGQQTCLSRFRNGFPATALTLAGCKNINSQDVLASECYWNQCAVDATEQALLCCDPVVAPQIQAVEKPSVYKLLEALCDKNDDQMTLHDMRIGDLLPFVKSLLKDIYHVYLDDKIILQLTKKKILEMELNISEREFEKKKGLDLFFSYVDDDELRETTDLIPMTTLVYDVKTMDDGIDECKPTLFVIPGLEGHHARFRSLCERLKLPAFVLQPGLDRPHETPAELASRYSKVLLETFKLSQNFYLLGYECGIFVALELAHILEDHGLTGTVYCLGAGPDQMKSLLEKELSPYESEPALQEGVARHMFSLMARAQAAGAAEPALRGCGSWRERMDACVRSLLGRAPYTAQYTRAMLEAAYMRIVTQRHYSAEPRALRSQIVLMRVSDIPHRGEECSLQCYSSRPLVVHDLVAPMAQATDDLRVSAFINKYLRKDVLDAYNTFNLCESYLSQ